MDCIALLIKRNRRLALRLTLASKLQKQKKKHFDLDRYDDSQCLSLFRFTKLQIRELRNLLKIPWKVKSRIGTICFGEEAFCIFLRRMSYPNRLVDLSLMFDKSCSELSIIFNLVLNHVVSNFGFLITDLNQWWLSKEYLNIYCEAVSQKGAPLKRCFGFIDGTVRPMCRPSRYQKECYNGHKRTHSLKYQSVTIPSGIIANLFGPIEGRRHDAFLLSESGLLAELEKINEGEADPYYLYGDPAYPIRLELQGPFKGSQLSAEQVAFNKSMSISRVSVEWAFGKVLSLWAFVDFKKNQRLFLQPLGKYFKAAVLLTNIHTCYNGSQTSTFFNVPPPSVEMYLNV